MTQRAIYDPSLDWDDEDLHSVELSAREWDAILAALQNTELRTHTDPGTIIALICEQLPEEILEDTPEPGVGSPQQATLPRQPNAGTLEPSLASKPTVDELMGWLSGNPDSSTAGSRHAASETSHDAPPTMVCSACGSDEVFYDAFIGVNDQSDIRQFSDTHCAVCDGPAGLTVAIREA